MLRLSRDVLDEGLGSDRWESLLVKSLVERFRELETRLAEAEKRPGQPLPGGTSGNEGPEAAGPKKGRSPA